MTLPPVDFCAARSFGSFEALGAYHASPMSGIRYGRDANTAVADAERALAAFEPGKKAVLFNSGMSAASALLDVLMHWGWTLALPGECYRKLDPLAEARLYPLRRWTNVSDLEALPAGPLVVWVESPSNPHLQVADYERLLGLKAERPDTVIVGDLTFAGLDNWTGPDLFDAIVHSATKYIGGHNDLVAGVVFADADLAGELWKRRSYGGGIADPMTAYLLTRSLETYDLRIERQVRNAGKVLAWLLGQGVDAFYPEARQPWHRHRGAVISFRVPGLSKQELTDLVSSLDVISMAPSFGAVRSMIEVPATMSHWGKSDMELADAGIEADLVRLSIGTEPADAIISDLEKVLS